jgi:molybdate transport system substrate-binding protein
MTHRPPPPRPSRRALLAGSAAVLAGAAVAQPPPLVFAAASLAGVLQRLGEAWAAAGGAGLRVSAASSAALARQLQQGAPADVFISADLEWMEWAEGRQLIRAGTRRILAGNRLVLVTARDNPAQLTLTRGVALAAALGDGRLATGEPASVPLGRYARQALTALGVWEAVSPRLAGAENAAAAAMLVARREAAFGILYATDAAANPALRVVDVFPAATHEPIRYPMAVTRSATHPEAGALLAYLASPPAERLLAEAGFLVPG